MMNTAFVFIIIAIEKWNPWGDVPVPLPDEKVTVWELVAHLSSQDEYTKAFNYFYYLIRDIGKKKFCVLQRFNNIWKLNR